MQAEGSCKPHPPHMVRLMTAVNVSLAAAAASPWSCRICLLLARHEICPSLRPSFRCRLMWHVLGLSGSNSQTWSSASRGRTSTFGVPESRHCNHASPSIPNIA